MMAINDPSTKETNKDRFLFLLWIGLLFFFFFLRISQGIRNNNISVYFLKEVIGSPPADLPKIDQVAGHDRALLWMIDQAVARGDFNDAQDYWNRFDNKGYFLSSHYDGYILYHISDSDNAFQSWIDIGDINALNQIAKQAETAGDAVLASSVYEKLYKLAPKSHGFDFVRSLVNNQEYGKAEVVLRNILSTQLLEEQKAVGYILLGDIYSKQKNWFEAEKAYQIALDSDQSPSNTNALIGLAWAKYEQGGIAEDAIRSFEIVNELDPESGIGLYNLGLVYAREGRFIDAIEKFDSAVEKDQENLWWNLVRARTAVDGENYPLAIDYYQEIIAAFPSDIRAYYEAATLYWREGDISSALDTIEKTLQLMNEPDFWIYFRAGSIFEDAGDLTRAEWAYNQALTIMPDNKTVEKRLDNLS
ncbi:MAG: tetratricopeptide repeat protein, partial [Anaerolineaceae bacterium]|nr:tetratricopeptide repeat protein [Anaerolineaceae bacterium]